MWANCFRPLRSIICWDIVDLRMLGVQRAGGPMYLQTAHTWGGSKSFPHTWVSQTPGYRITHPCLNLKNPPTLNSGGGLAWGGGLWFLPLFWHAEIMAMVILEGSLKQNQVSLSSCILCLQRKVFFVMCDQFKSSWTGPWHPQLPAVSP